MTKHADRDACEISVSIHVSTNLPDKLKDWAFKIKTPDTYTDNKKTAVLVPGEERSAILNPGDGLLYKGCERPHWRDAMPTPEKVEAAPKEYYYHQIFFLDHHRILTLLKFYKFYRFQTHLTIV